MMRSLYSGVSGLQNHQTRMDVIGNNISNVNSTGFKKGRVNFQDMISQNLQGAASPNDERGGVNPKQVGLGMSIASIDTIHTQGSLQTTGVKTDLAIQGNGFFVLKNGNQELYSRAGAFSLDQNGFLVNPANGLKVQGWLAQIVDGETSINTAGDVEDIIIPVGTKDPARATSEVELRCNLDKRLTPIAAGDDARTIADKTWTITKDVYDSFGNVHSLQVSFTKDAATENRWIATMDVDPTADIATNTLINNGDPAAQQNTFFVDFDNQGALTAVLDANGDELTSSSIPVIFDVAESNPATQQEFILNLGDIGSYTDTVTQFADKSSTKAFRQNGNAMGYMDTFQIDQSGIITGVFSNGTSRELGQLALASFTNPRGLEKAGDSTFVVSNNSGEPDVGPSGIAGKGKFISGALEMSNVDLAEQFTDMIVTQRGFQANSKTITTSDQMLQELLGLKR